MTSSGFLIDDIFTAHANRSLFILADGREISYAGFLASAEAMAARLAELGLVPGDRVLVTLDNGEPVLRFYLAAALAGVAVCPVDPATPATRVAQLTRDLAPKLVLDATTLADLMTAPSVPYFGEVDPDRDLLILFSSGTTGEPKGIIHSLRTLSESARSFAGLSGLSTTSVIYHHFPMFYMAGIFNLFFCPMMAGATIVVGPKFSAMSMLRFWELPRAHGVNHLTLTPTMALWLSQLYRSDDALLDHIQGYEAIISTGSALYASVAKRFADVFGTHLRSCYGVTELGGSITLQDWDEAAAISPTCGPFQPEISIIAGTSAETASEIRVKTPFMMKGYLTRAGVVSPFDADGYFATGDVGYVKDGILSITGRNGDVIKKGGEFVSLVDIESLALSLPQISDAAVVPVADDYWGNRIVLFYVPAAGITEGESIAEALSAVFADNLRRIEHPDKIIPVPFMPKTSIGKTIKRLLIERYSI